VRRLERRQTLVESFRDGCCCVLTPHCRLKGKLARAREAFLRELDETTFAECAYPPMPPHRAANLRRLAS
jgi:Rrf2 family nitric oxide-sensitive transcriptional repressor